MHRAKYVFSLIQKANTVEGARVQLNYWAA